MNRCGKYWGLWIQQWLQDLLTGGISTATVEVCGQSNGIHELQNTYAHESMPSRWDQDLTEGTGPF